MTKTIEEYLQALKVELKGRDNAIIQDALADAEDHLRTALAAIRESGSDLNEADALEQIIEQYGTPEETAAAYMEVERRTYPGLSPAVVKKRRSALVRFFGIYADPRAWGSLFYMLIAFVTGLIYFTWATMGISISISFSLFIFGLPIALLFLLSVRGLAWLEGRLVEALLGVRMPRRSIPAPQNKKFLDRIKALATDKHTWLSMLYLVLQGLIGTIYFYVLVAIFAFSLTAIGIPILQEVFHLPIVQTNYAQYFLPQWGYPLAALAGILLWTCTMHLVKWVGNLHGRYAKALLVTE